MPLFQKSVVNKFLKNLNQQTVEEAYKQFQRFYDDAECIENIRLLKEENYQEGFLREIFVDVLGYTINPNKNYNLTTEYKNETDSKKADGASVVLGDSILQAGDYTQIRLILANGNYVIDNGVKHDLNVPSGSQTGIKLNHGFTIEPNTLYELMLDFNVDKSIHITGNGQYMLKPVIRCMSMITSGTISGQVLPLDAQAIVFTTVGLDTVTTYPDVQGFFKLMALPQGTYSVEFAPVNPAYKDTVLTGVNVLANQNNNIGLVELRTNP
jgi:hypothetical protein